MLNNMGDIFAIRGVREKTRCFIHTFARERRMKAASALDELIRLAQVHLQEKGKAGKKYKYHGLMDGYGKLLVHSDDTHVSEHIDDIVYGD